ncbi:hypothetical protein EAS64_02420 [Trebonia kvetii]|uniref:AbiTii domain-containing protein n=2 Tax=Actinomycetes TaxID=1760 RepID=A0A6P2C7J7_9ACTN|nr:hypothetical protein [Trebonia kvetii]TVZ06306.1 hypothetical protein EAS64_02420 [Trebonia kvetii]
MARNQGGLLARIAEDVADRSVPLSSLLQNCIVLGGLAGSEKMRTWASQELHGYDGAVTVPQYRHVPAPLTARITNRAGRFGITQRVEDSMLDSRIREEIGRTVDVHDAIVPFGIGQLEAMAVEDTDEQRLSPEWGGFIADVLNRQNIGPTSHVADVYWSVPRSAIQGVLVRIRTALAELVAELLALTPQGQDVPDKMAADQGVQFLITGDRTVFNYIVQHAGAAGTNVAATAGPVAVAGESGTAIGSQSAGANSSVAGSQEASGAGASVAGVQSTRAGGDAVAAGQDASVSLAGKEPVPVKEGWWARLRKRGVVVAFATVIGALAGVAAVVVAIMVAAGWKP